METKQPIYRAGSIIRCERCIARLAECPTNEYGKQEAYKVFKVGNSLRPEMGHAKYYTSSDYIIPLCTAERIIGRQ